MCCPKGKIPKLGRPDGPNKASKVKCVRSRRQQTNTLIGATVTVTEPDNENVTKTAVLAKSGQMLPKCPYALRVERMTLKIHGIKIYILNRIVIFIL